MVQTFYLIHHIFASGARRLTLSVIGFTQYISATISLLIGIFAYHEGFTAVDMIGLGFIWAALAIYSLSQMGGIKGYRTV